MNTRLHGSILLALLWVPAALSGQVGAGDSLPPPGSEPGSAYVEQYLPQDQWHEYCLPVKTSVTYPFISLDLDMRWYDEPLHNWVQVSDTTGDSLLATPMLGYKLYSSSGFPGNSIIGVKGQLNTGSVALPVTSTPSAYGADGWNLAGNPYPSAVDWYLVELEQVDPTLFIYSSLWHNYIFWNRYNGIHTSICRSVIPAMQGFFVHCHADAPQSGLVIMTNDARLHDPGQIYQENPDYDSLLVISVYANAYKDEMITWFSDSASSGFGFNEDALKFPGDPGAPQLFSLVAGGIPLALNVRPFDGPATRVNLGFVCRISGTDTLVASNLGSFPDTTEIWLEDKKENQFQKLNSDPQYIFSSSPGDDTARFVIRFSNPYTGLSWGIPPVIRIWSDGGKLFIDLSKSTGSRSLVPLELFDLTGRLVFTSDLTGEVLNILTPGLHGGYYVVRVTGEREIAIRKVFLE